MPLPRSGYRDVTTHLRHIPTRSSYRAGARPGNTRSHGLNDLHPRRFSSILRPVVGIARDRASSSYHGHARDGCLDELVHAPALGLVVATQRLGILDRPEQPAQRREERPGRLAWNIEGPR